MKCEYCRKENDGDYATGRFCNKKCARGFSTKEKREEINKKVSKTLIGIKYPNRKKRKDVNSYKKQGESLKKYYSKLNENKPFEKLSEKYKRERILKEQKNRCNCCGNNFIWMEKVLIPHLHHKDGNCRNGIRENHEILCPNCHSQTNNYAFKNRRHSEDSKKKMVPYSK
jgi:5-methylcytosine-specific restriction endonuclease McrA